jgi:metallo-beta-lactamase class B
MPSRFLVSVAAAACTAVAAASPIVAQGRGGQGNRPAAYPTEQQFTQSKEAQQHVAAARALAKDDLVRDFENACTAMGPQRPALVRQMKGLPPLEKGTAEPTKIFDNVWFLGLNDQGAFAVTTSDGIILIDTLNTTEEARDILVPSMKQVGLDPARIKYIVLSHGHPGQTDHTGGASYLQKTYGAKVMMGKSDWDLTLPAQKPERPLATRDGDIVDGTTLTLGDTTLTFAMQPGHTPGSLAMFIPVKHQGRPHTMMILAGVFQTPNRQSLVAFEHVVDDYARKLKAEAVFNSHPDILQNTHELMAAMRKNPNGANPFLYGPERADRYLSMIVECARARVVAMESGQS